MSQKDKGVLVFLAHKDFAVALSRLSHEMSQSLHPLDAPSVGHYR